MKYLKKDKRSDIIEMCKYYTNDVANKQCDGHMLAYWVIGLLENIDEYPDWYTVNESTAND